MKLTLTFDDRPFDHKIASLQFSERKVSTQKVYAALSRLYNNYVQALFNYGMQLCGDDEAVKLSIQMLFIDVKENKMASLTCSTEVYKLFREFLILQTSPTRQSTAWIPVSISVRPDLSRLRTEATFLRLQCNFTYEEIAAIMAINQESVCSLIHQAIMKANEKKDKSISNE
jgi:hypothetical protein